MSIHDNNHIIINYDDKEYICDIHNEIYNSFCDKCKKNICIECEKNHNEHKLLFYNNLIIEDDKINTQMEEIRKEIDTFNNNIKEKIKQLNKIIENIEGYYKIINNIIKNYLNNKKSNFQNLININKIINNNAIISNIKAININNKFNDIIDIYNKVYNINIKNINNINNKNENIDDNNIIIYKIDGNNDIVKIFGKEFVNNNKNKIKLEIEGNEYELMEYYKIQDKNKKNLEIKIKGIENVTNMSYIFKECSLLLKLPDM